MAELWLVRHGQSTYNLENVFTGWLDPLLTELGIKQAREVGLKLKVQNKKPDVIYTSVLTRAHQTLAEINEVLGLESVPVIKDQALNERHYGELQGKNKAQTAVEFSEEQVHIWRRSFDVPPPGGESLKDTAARTLPYFEKEILPQLQAGKNVLVVAHGNSLRSIVMSIEKLSPEQILKKELGTGEILSYQWTGEHFKVL